jgi:hypothetical protein
MYYFVSELGDDAFSGNINAPFRTIQRGLNLAIPGDTVYVRQGVYLEKAVFPNSGLSDAAIKLSGYPGELPSIDSHGIHIGGGEGILSIWGKDFIEIENLRLINSGHSAIFADGCEGLFLRHNKTFNTAESAFWLANSSNVVVGNNEIERASTHKGNACLLLANLDGFEVYGNCIHHSRSIGKEIGPGEGLTMWAGCQNGRVYRNHIYKVASIGIYIDAWNETAHDIEIYQNAICDCFSGGVAIASEGTGTVNNIRFHHNVIFGNSCTGVQIAKWGASGPNPMDNLEINHNLIFDNGNHQGYCETANLWGGVLHKNPDATNVNIKHNILSRNAGFQIVLDNGAVATVDDNLIDGFMGAPGEVVGTNPTMGDAQFLVALAANQYASN